jgi:hypothetical protein
MVRLRLGLSRDLRFGLIFFPASAWRVGDVAPSLLCCPLAAGDTARFRGANTLISPLPRAGRPPLRHPCRRRSGSPPEPSTRSRRVPRELLDATEDLPKERRRQVALGQLQDEVSGVPNEASAGLEQPLLETREGPALNGDG